MNASWLLSSVGWAVLNSLWQMAFLYVLYQLICTVTGIKNHNIKLRFSFILLTAGFFLFVYSIFSGANNFFSITQIVTASYSNISLINTSVLSATITILYFPFLMLSGWQFIKNFRFADIIKHNGHIKAPLHLRLFANQSADILKIPKKVQLKLSQYINVPVVIGFLKPVILLPAAAVNQLTTSQLEAIILHELAHIRKNDFLINLLSQMMRTFLYFNPFAGYFVRQIEVEREYEADKWVIQFDFNAADYASALLTLERNNIAAFSIAASGNGQYGSLKNRVLKIMGAAPVHYFPFSKIRVALLTTLVIAVVAFIQPQLKFTPKISSYMAATPAQLPGTLPGLIIPVNLNTVTEHKNIAITTTATSTAPSFKAITEKTNTVNLQPLAAAKNIDRPSSYQFVADYTTSLPERTVAEKEIIDSIANNTMQVLVQNQLKKVMVYFAEQVPEKEKLVLQSEINRNNAVEHTQLANDLKNMLTLQFDTAMINKMKERIAIANYEVMLDSLQLEYNIAYNYLINLKNSYLNQQLDLSLLPENFKNNKAEFLNFVEDKKVYLLGCLDYIKKARPVKVIAL